MIRRDRLSVPLFVSCNRRRCRYCLQQNTDWTFDDNDMWALNTFLVFGILGLLIIFHILLLSYLEASWLAQVRFDAQYHPLHCRFSLRPTRDAHRAQRVQQAQLKKKVFLRFSPGFPECFSFSQGYAPRRKGSFAVVFPPFALRPLFLQCLLPPFPVRAAMCAGACVCPCLCPYLRGVACRCF